MVGGVTTATENLKIFKVEEKGKIEAWLFGVMEH